MQTEIQPSAILDLHFQAAGTKEHICGAVSSTATLALFSFSPDQSASRPLTLLRTVRLPAVGDDVLFLSFAWHPSIEDLVALTTSTGHVHLLKLGADGEHDAIAPNPILVHSLETWCVALAPSVSPHETLDLEGLMGDGATFMMLSGGDDSMLRYTTCVLSTQACSEESELGVDVPFPAVQMRGHDAGVTAILPLPLTNEGSELVVTGSYDDHIRLFSVAPLERTHGIRTTRKLAERNLGGGVWRLKLVEIATGDGGFKARILASCMHAGARLLELTKTSVDEYHIAIIARFEEHKSMNYGSDVQPGAKGTLRCVSTSFYDRLLCYWETKVPL